MKREDLIKALDSIRPDREAERRMLDNILAESKKARKAKGGILSGYKSAVPAMAAVLAVVAGLTIWGISSGRLYGINTDDNRFNAGDSIGSAPREDAPALLKDQFQLGNRHYVILGEGQRKEFGFPQEVLEDDVGERIARISDSVDESLVGLYVYRYIPAGGEAVVAVGDQSGYRLYKFFAFESYLNNSDEDARDYLELYGIYSADDISRIVFIGTNDQAKLENREMILAELTDRQKIDKFYDYYSVISDSSEKYFERLFNGARDMTDLPSAGYNHASDASGPKTGYKATPEDQQPQSKSRVESSGGHPGTGSDALENPVTIRIYNRKGVYLETVYYPNIGFISRHEVSDEFAAFLDECLEGR